MGESEAISTFPVQRLTRKVLMEEFGRVRAWSQCNGLLGPQRVSVSREEGEFDLAVRSPLKSPLTRARAISANFSKGMEAR